MRINVHAITGNETLEEFLADKYIDDDNNVVLMAQEKALQLSQEIEAAATHDGIVALVLSEEV